MNMFKLLSRKPALIATGLSAVLLPFTASALPQVPEEPGWAGEVLLGVSYIDVDSNTLVGNNLLDLGEPSIGSINQENKSTDDTIGALSGEVRWTLPRQNQIFLGNSVEDRVTLDGVTQLGWRKGTKSAGTFQVGVVSTNAITMRVYDDPYRTDGDGDRKTTNRDGNGIRLQWDRIFNTMFEVQLTARDIDVDTEKSGREACVDDPNGIGFGDADACTDSLRRDGDLTALKVAYMFNPGGGSHFLRPELAVTNMDADGNAKEYDSAVLQVAYSYLGDDFKFVGTLAAGERDYDSANVLYGEDQDSDIMVASVTGFYKLPFGDGRWQAVGSAYYGDIDSDIDFHDTEGTGVTLAVQYNFGERANVRETKQR